MSDEAKKCANANCTCTVTDKKYCSQYCEDAAGTTSLACDCPHQSCGAHM